MLSMIEIVTFIEIIHDRIRLYTRVGTNVMINVKNRPYDDYLSFTACRCKALRKGALNQPRGFQNLADSTKDDA